MADKERYSKWLRMIQIAVNSNLSLVELSDQLNMPKNALKKQLEMMQDMKYTLMLDDESDHNKLHYTDGYEDAKILIVNTFGEYLLEKLSESKKNAFDDLNGLYTKSNFSYGDADNNLIVIDMAIREKKRLASLYELKDKTLVPFEIEPLAIVFYEFDNLFYIIGQYDNRVVTYRLDRFQKLKVTKEAFVQTVTFDVEEYCSKIWGMEYGEPIKVKVKFFKFANIEHKVKRDLATRKYAKLTNHEDYFIYEDEVVGINSFKRWLRAYGGSAVVEEPQSLREDMIASARRCYDVYK